MKSKKNQDTENRLFRLTLADNATHEEIYAIKFSKLGFFSTIALLLCVIIGAVYSILVFTPLHYSIPGYPDANFRSQALYNAVKIDSLESAMIRWELYAVNINRTLNGEQTLSLEEVTDNSHIVPYLEQKNINYLQKQDSILRAKVKEEEQFGLSSGAKRDLPIEGIHFFTPLVGVISNGFDLSTHPAVDITAPANSVVKACLDGTVIYSGWSNEYGYTISIQHDSDLVSTYKHNRSLLKKQGDKVKAGTPIAYVGDTGNTSNGDHLHFELWYKGSAVNPTLYISF